METRSKSQSGKSKCNMAEDENHSTGKPAFKSLNTARKMKEDKSGCPDNDRTIFKAVIDPNIGMEIDREGDAVRGLVASRVEQINNSPFGTPVAEQRTLPTKKKYKKKLLGTKNGKLSIEDKEDDAMTDQIVQLGNHAELESLSDGSASLVSILKELNTSVRRLESKIDNMEKDRKANNKRVRQLSVIQQQDSSAITDLTNTVSEQKDKIKSLTGIVVQQQHQINELSHKLNSLFLSNNSKKLTIGGLAETQGENCFHEVANFFKNILKLDAHIPLKLAIRVGQGSERLMMIKLQNFNHKAIIFQKLDKLKQENKSRQNPYFISDVLPEAWAERRRFVQHIKHQNSRLPADAQRNLSVKKGRSQWMVLHSSQYFKHPVHLRFST